MSAQIDNMPLKQSLAQLKNALLAGREDEQQSAWPSTSLWGEAVVKRAEVAGVVAGNRSTEPAPEGPSSIKNEGKRRKKRRVDDAATDVDLANAAVLGIDPASLNKMRRVDWRWAGAKGFLNKETNEWNEELGGMKAYLAQRNKRMITRNVRLLPILSCSSSFSRMARLPARLPEAWTVCIATP